MKLAILILIAFAADCAWGYAGFYATPYELIQELIDRNQIEIKEISSYIDSDKFENLFESVMKTRIEYLTLFEKRFSKVLSENHVPLQDFPWDRSEEDMGVCEKIAGEIDPDVTAFDFVDIIFDCSRLFSNNSLFISYGEQLYYDFEIEDFKLALKKDIASAKEYLYFHDFFNNKLPDSVMLEWLTELRKELQHVYNYEIVPFKKDLEELLAFTSWSVPECMSDENPVIKSFWQKIEANLIRYKNCKQ